MKNHECTQGCTLLHHKTNDDILQIHVTDKFEKKLT